MPGDKGWKVRQNDNFRAKASFIHLDAGRTALPAKRRVRTHASLNPLQIQKQVGFSQGTLCTLFAVSSQASCYHDAEAPECALCHSPCSRAGLKLRGLRGKAEI
jgi:hypothetical protein